MGYLLLLAGWVSCRSVGNKPNIQIHDKQLDTAIRNFIAYLPESFLYQGDKSVFVSLMKPDEKGQLIHLSNHRPLKCEGLLGFVYLDGFTVYVASETLPDSSIIRVTSDFTCDLRSRENDMPMDAQHFEERLYVRKNGLLRPWEAAPEGHTH